MSILVQKFGGTSVADIECLERVADIVIQAKEAGHQLVVVVSAMAGETDRLIELAKQSSPSMSLREYDALVSTGEQVSMSLLSMILIRRGHSARSFNGRQAGILTDERHQKARILTVDTRRVEAELNAGHIAIVAGFQGYTEHGDVTTLGRGGSDTTAVALAAALASKECQIYTDVEGVYTADPRIVPAACHLNQVTFEEMLEMAGLGAKVLQNRAVRYAGRFQVPLRVLSTFNQGEGTLITYEESPMEQPKVSGIAFNRSEAKITLIGLPMLAGVSAAVLQPITDHNIDIDMIIQSIGVDDKVNFTFTVNREEYQAALTLMQAVAKKLKAGEVTSDNKIAKLSIVGVGMRAHAGVANKMFEVLAKEGIMIQAIATSEIKISVIIDEKYLELGARALHTAFGLDTDTKEEFDPVVKKQDVA